MRLRQISSGLHQSPGTSFDDLLPVGVSENSTYGDQEKTDLERFV